jgi:hypothetical protein
LFPNIADETPFALESVLSLLTDQLEDRERGSGRVSRAARSARRAPPPDQHR